CQSTSSAGLAFSASSVAWLDPVQASWSVSLGPSCPGDTIVALVENTNQTNENPQSYVVGQVAYWAVTLNLPTTFSGSKTVVPLRSLPWILEMISPSQVDPVKILAGAYIEEDLPGPLTNGQTTVTVTDNTVDSRRQFVRAVQTPGEVVTVAGNVDL